MKLRQSRGRSEDALTAHAPARGAETPVNKLVQIDGKWEEVGHLRNVRFTWHYDRLGLFLSMQGG
jgi:hypothetical protein